MDNYTIFTKTAKGLGETLGKTKNLSREQRKILKEIDGKASFENLVDQIGMDAAKLEAVINKLQAEDYIREFGSSAPPGDRPAGETIFDLTSPAIIEAANSQLTIGDFFRAMEQPQTPAESGSASLNFKDLREPDAGIARKTLEQTAAQVEEIRRAIEEEAQRITERAQQAAEAARREAEAKARQEAESARQQALAQEQARAKQEAQEQARRAAEEQARKAAEEAERQARIRAEQEARRQAEEVARRAAEEQARREAEELARRQAEEEARKLAQERARKQAEEAARLKAEEEARLAAEARARAEAQERERARLQAEEEARRAAEARAREEAEAQARREAEELVRRQQEEEARRLAEEEARKQAQEQARIKAWEAARRAAEELAQREAEAKAKAEAERLAQMKAEEEARQAAAAEASRQAEEAARRAAEEQARREAEEQARLRAEEEARRAAEEKARREAEELAKKEAREHARKEAEEAARLKAEEKARQKAEAKAKKEADAQAKRAAREQAQREAEEQARQEAERKAQQAAEAKARKEAEEQAKREAKEKARQAAEDAARQKAEEAARLKAEKEAEKAARKAAEEAAKEAAAKEVVAKEEATRLAAAVAVEEQTQQGEDKTADTAASEYAPRSGSGFRITLPFSLGKLARFGAVALVGLAAVGLGLLHVVPFNGRLAQLEQDASARFGKPVKIGSLNLSLLPQPHWRLQEVTIGAVKQIAIPEVDAAAALGSLFSGEMHVKSIKLVSPVIDEEGLGWILFGQSSGAAWQAASLNASKVRLRLPQMQVPAFDASTEMDADGSWRKIALNAAAEKLHLDLERAAGKLRFELTANDMVLPFGGTLAFDTLNASGTAERAGLEIAKFTGLVYDGTVSGTGTLRWQDGWSLKGEAQARHIAPVRLAPGVFQGGTLEGDFRYAMQASEAAKLLASPQARGSFSINGGALMGVDMASQVMGQAGSGRTAFNELNGDFILDGGKVKLSRMRLAAGLLSAAGDAGVDADGKLSGHVMIDLRTASRQAHSALSLGGTPAAPQFSR